METAEGDGTTSTRSSTTGAMDQAVNNPVILSRILSYLPLPDLKSVRRVHSFWLKESKPHFLRRARVEFRLEKMSEWTPKFESYLADYPTNNHQNFFIDTSSVAYDVKLEKQERATCIAMITRLLNVVGGQVKSLDLEWNVSTDPSSRRGDYLSFNTILRLTPNVVELGLGIYCSKKGYQTSLSTENLVLPTFQNFDTTFQFRSMPLKMYQALLAIPNQMGRIDLGGLTKDVWLLQRILEKHANTLEEVELGCDRDRYSNIIVMPNCPKLKKIVFTYALEVDEFARITGQHIDYDQEGFSHIDFDRDLLNLRGMLQSGPEALKKKFPCLQSIQVIGSVHSPRLYLGCFFPAGDNLVFPQITELIVELEEWCYGHDDPSSPEYWPTRFNKMFPRAVIRLKGVESRPMGQYRDREDGTTAGIYGQ